ncbi:MAG: SLC13 family permease, partial [Halobacteria archaeon]|nr:SLC13 family permease [Halobacteria archaeon]
LVDETVGEAKLRERYDTTVLAIRRGGEIVRENLEEVVLNGGDTLLLQTTPEAAEHLSEVGDLVVTHGLHQDPTHPAAKAGDVAPLSPKTPIALLIMVGVIGLAALGVVPIVISALGGVFVMVATGCLTPSDMYDAVSWNVIFLLAGVLPLGVAMQQTGGDTFIAGFLGGLEGFVPALGVLFVFYLMTGLLANIITPVASVVLMIPIAVDTASRIGANRFAFLLGVMFAGSSAFMTPIGYQTNLMVYGPGGYRFTDYIRVGAPLQMLLAVVTTVGIAVWFGV